MHWRWKRNIKQHQKRRTLWLHQCMATTPALKCAMQIKGSLLTMISALSTPLIIDTDLGSGHKWQQLIAVVAGMIQTTSFMDGWMDGWEASPYLLAQNTIFFFKQCETKLFCFKSFILIHILFCTVHYMSVYGCKCFFYVCVQFCHAKLMFAGCPLLKCLTECYFTILLLGVV